MIHDPLGYVVLLCFQFFNQKKVKWSKHMKPISHSLKKKFECEVLDILNLTVEQMDEKAVKGTLN